MSDKPLAVVPSYDEYLTWLGTYKRPPSYEDVYSYLTSNIRPIVWPSEDECRKAAPTEDGANREDWSACYAWLKAEVEGI